MFIKLINYGWKLMTQIGGGLFGGGGGGLNFGKKMHFLGYNLDYFGSIFILFDLTFW